MLSFALRRETPLVLGEEFKDILDFIESKKNEEANGKNNLLSKIDNAYQEYLNEMLAGVEDTEDYKFISLLSMNERIDTLIKINKENNSDYSKYIEFKEKQQESSIYKSAVEKEIKMLLGIMSKEEFTAKYLKENNITNIEEKYKNNN